MLLKGYARLTDKPHEAVHCSRAFRFTYLNLIILKKHVSIFFPKNIKKIEKLLIGKIFLNIKMMSVKSNSRAQGNTEPPKKIMNYLATASKNVTEKKAPPASDSFPVPSSWTILTKWENKMYDDCEQKKTEPQKTKKCEDESTDGWWVEEWEYELLEKEYKWWHEEW